MLTRLDAPRAPQAESLCTIVDRAAPQCRRLVEAIETLLNQRRQRDAQRLAAPHLKRWTREEVCNLAYSSYKSMVYGKVRYLPPREEIEEIADYLECTLVERNQLLKAAGCALTCYDLHGDALDRGLRLGTRAVTATMLPACLVARDWSLHAINAPLLAYLHGTHVIELPPEQRTVLHLLFDPAFGVRACLEQNGRWAWFAHHYIALFRQQQTPCVHEAWYDGLLARLVRLPDFAYCWSSGSLDAYAPSAAPGAISPAHRHTRLVTNFDGAAYPQVWTFLVDE